ncbi:hypothetical protein ACIGFK_14370 [Streptomyces sp. NPDC085524]|uniref:hypothetical protein n=1 Tax=Streptomyces sp. NPDC085524 TaxID=3365728 RepID=UPI0037D8D8B7
MTPTSRAITEDGVSARTADALRMAMRRLFEGRAQHTDGRLTKENLWREAQVSRATMNRATTILNEWDTHLTQNGTATPGEARRDEEIAKLRRQLTERARECTVLQRRLNAAATAIAALHHDNAQLRDELACSNGRVTVLH